MVLEPLFLSQIKDNFPTQKVCPTKTINNFEQDVW